MEQTTARLRKTFQYPTDEDDDSLPEALDEEEQESLIRALVHENTSRNTQYKHILLAIPLLSSIPYIPTLFTPQTTFLSLLSLTSLFSTAYLIYTLPPGSTAIPILDAIDTNPDKNTKPKAIRNAGGLLIPGTDYGPVVRYLPYLNIVLSVLLALLGMVARGRVEIWFGFAWLPGSVYGVALLAKVVMGSVNPEAELSALRYEFKGA